MTESKWLPTNFKMVGPVLTEPREPLPSVIELHDGVIDLTSG
jgi:hypothetical protein